MTGSSFPLYAAPVETIQGYLGPGACFACQQTVSERLRLGVGADVGYRCAGCGQEFAVPADEHDDAAPRCPSCATPADPYPLGAQPAVCFACLRAGRAAFTKDTEFGMVRWEDAVRGRTHGLPRLPSATPFAVTAPDGSGWTSVEIPPAVLIELVRTPTYLTWQGDRWLFCCGRPMVYRGELSRADLPAVGTESAFLAIFPEAQPWILDHVPATPERTGNSDWGFYAFDCPSCHRVRGHFDVH